VVFDPAAAGAKQATLNINSDDPYTPVYQVALTGNALPVAGQGQSPPAAGGAGVTVFKIGQASFNLNGTTVNMDVAPYIEDGRTFLPLRYVANALGVQDSNIMYDPASREVTVIKGSTTVQLTIGSTAMLVNDAVITMDVAPEIKSGRTCLPAAWVGKALGANIAWDATNQTVTISPIN
jgi:hypothetical protein